MNRKHIAAALVLCAVLAVVAIPASRRRAEHNCVKALYTAPSGAQTWRQKCNRQGSSAPACMSLPAVTWIDGERATIDRKTCAKFSMVVA